MNNQTDWKTVKKPKKIINRDISQKNNNSFGRSITKNINELNLDTLQNDNQTQIEDLPLIFNYVFWCHDIYNKDWDLHSYKKLCVIQTVSEFWKLFNNLHKLGYKTNNFFLMKEGTNPIWEHENNRYGGLCSFKTDIDVSLKTYEDLCIRMMCGLLTDNPDELDDINGISYSPKNNWSIIKIWNKDKNNDLSKIMKSYILTTYKNASIKYKENEPEY